MVGGPPIAVGYLVAPDLSLNRSSYLTAYPGNHDKTAMLANLRAAERLVWRNDAVHRVTIVLDLRHGALLHREPARIGVIVNGGRSNDRMDCRL